MKCLLYFGITSMRDDTSAPLSGRGELHGGARVLILVAENVYFKLHKRNKIVSVLVSALSLGKMGGCSLDKLPQERHGSDFFLLDKVMLPLRGRSRGVKSWMSTYCCCFYPFCNTT